MFIPWDWEPEHERKEVRFDDEDLRVIYYYPRKGDDESYIQKWCLRGERSRWRVKVIKGGRVAAILEVKKDRPSITVKSNYNPDFIRKIKTIRGRIWKHSLRAWLVPNTEESFLKLVAYTIECFL